MRSRRPMGSDRKYAGFHGPRIVDDRLEVHVREDVAVDVDAGRDLDQLQAAGVRRNTQRSVT